VYSLCQYSSAGLMDHGWSSFQPGEFLYGSYVHQIQAHLQDSVLSSVVPFPWSLTFQDERAQDNRKRMASAPGRATESLCSTLVMWDRPHMLRD
jgi:hypothetical protein